MKETADSMTEVSVEAEEMGKEVKKGADEGRDGTEALSSSVVGLRQKLVTLAVEGKKNTEEYKRLEHQFLRAKQESDRLALAVRAHERGGDTVLRFSLAAQAMAGSVGVAGQALALFGEESEELAVVLQKVNAISSIASSLMAVNYAIEQGRFSLMKKEVILKNIQLAQMRIENALQSESVIVRGLATAAQWALNIAMAANPYAAAAIGLAALIVVMTNFIKHAAEAKTEAANLNEELANIAKLEELDKNDLARRQKKAQADLDIEKAAQYKKTLLDLKGAEDELKLQRRTRAELVELQRKTLSNTVITEKERGKLVIETDKKIEAQSQKILDKEVEVYGLRRKAAIDFQNSVRDVNDKAEAERRDKQAAADAAARKAEEERIKALKLKFDDLIAAQDRLLLRSKEGSGPWLKAMEERLRLEKQKSLETEQLTQNQRALIIESTEKEIVDLKDKYRKINKEKDIQAAIATQQARLADPALELEERFAIETQIRELNYRKERAALVAQGESTLALDKQFQNEMLSARADFIKQLNALNAQATAAANFIRLAINDEVARNDKKTLDERIRAIRDTLDVKQDAANKEKDINDFLYMEGLISLTQFEKTEQELLNERFKNNQDAEQAITRIVETEEAKRNAKRKEGILLTLDSMGQAFELMSEFASAQTDRELQAVDYRRERLEALRETGSVTEKEYLRNLRVIDAEEKRIQNEAAKREKAFALFRAIIDTAAAVVKALPNLGLAILVGALGAAQVALIASKPIPKFRGGTKYSPEGLALVGEGGSELVETGGKMYLTPPKPTIVWLKGGSTVLTAEQTKGALRDMPRVNSTDMGRRSSEAGQFIDADKLAKSIGKHLKQVNVNIDKQGFNLYQQQGLNFTQYLNDRYKL